MKKLINEFDPEYPDQPVRYVDYEEAIENAADARLCIGAINNNLIKDSFIDGAKSLEAKEYWLNQFKQNNDLYIAMMLKAMYSEDEVKTLILANTNIYLDYIQALLEGKRIERPNLVKWLEEVLKK